MFRLLFGITGPEQMRKAEIGVGRGVFVAPWMGPTGELVLIAITSNRRLAGMPVTVPHGASRIQAAYDLWDQLDAVDPDVRERLKVI